MEFSFSKEEKLLQMAAHDFAKKEFGSRELESANQISPDTMRKMGDLGFFRLMIPETFGGESGSWVEIGILTEEIAKESISAAYLLMLCYEINLILANYGSKHIAEEWLYDLTTGRRLGCLSVTEPDAGSDFSNLKTRALRDGSSYTICGEKQPISFGSQAEFTIVFAMTNLEAGIKGITAFLVPLDLPGIHRTPIRCMGLLPSAPCSITFDEVRIPSEYRIGAEGQGFEINIRLGLFSELSRVLSALICVGASQAAVSMAILYAKKRFAFGRPIVQFEAISGKIAEYSTLIEAGKWLCYRALYLKDKELPHSKEAAMCSWWCPRVAFQAIKGSLLMHGHAGYSNDHPFQQMLRDVTAFEIIAGTEQILKLTIAQKVIGGMSVPGVMGTILSY